MKKNFFLIAAVFSMIIMSCSSNEPDPLQELPFNIIVQENSWVFDRAEFQSVNAIDYTLNSSEIEGIKNQLDNDYDYAYEGSLLSFNTDETGTYNSPGYCQDCSITWEMINGNNFKWAHRSSFNFCTLSVSSKEPELNWKLENLKGTYKSNGKYITIYYNLNLIFK